MYLSFFNIFHKFLNYPTTFFIIDIYYNNFIGVLTHENTDQGQVVGKGDKSPLNTSKSKRKERQMDKFISTREQYYKKTQLVNLIAHIERTMKENKNVLDKKNIKYNNEYSGNIIENFKELQKEAKEDYEKNSNQSFDRIQNLYIESVVNFSQENFFNIYKNNKEEIIKSLERYIKDIEKTFKIKSAGYALHLDEGHINKNCKVIYNPHFHISWINYDFENHKTSWRNIKRKDFSIFQDKVFENFKELGFERGISKEITKKSHLKKDEYIHQKHKEQEKIIKDNDKDLTAIEKILENYQNGKITLKNIQEAKIFYKDKKLIKRVLDNIYNLLNSQDITEKDYKKKTDRLEKNLNKMYEDLDKTKTEYTELKKLYKVLQIEHEHIKKENEIIKGITERTEETEIDKILKENKALVGYNEKDLKDSLKDFTDRTRKDMTQEHLHNLIIENNDRTTIKKLNLKVDSLESDIKNFINKEKFAETLSKTKLDTELKILKSSSKLDKEVIQRQNTEIEKYKSALATVLHEGQKGLNIITKYVDIKILRKLFPSFYKGSSGTAPKLEINNEHINTQNEDTEFSL